MTRHPPLLKVPGRIEHAFARLDAADVHYRLVIDASTLAEL
jgi:hypothetical protein